MALYISAGRRLRRTIATAVAAATVSLVVGLLIGRQQVPSIADRVREVQTAASDIAIGVERLDIEYEQTQTAGGGDTVAAGVLTPLTELRTRLQQTFDRAPWVTSQQRGAMLDDLAGVESAAKTGVKLDLFRSTLTKAGNGIRSALGGRAATP